MIIIKIKDLVVIGVPSNQFGGQEPDTEAEIKNFCETNFNITFPMTSKYDVKGDKRSSNILMGKGYIWKIYSTKMEFS